MATKFEEFVLQPSPDQRIWRYMSLGKFLSLMELQALFFTQIKRFDDKYEGYIEAFPGSDLYESIRRMMSLPNSPWSQYVVNCWCMNDYDTDALWSRYGGSSESVAICTTVEKLVSGISRSEFNGNELYWGSVTYVDPPQPKLEPGQDAGFQVNLFYKRPHFQDEREFRVAGSARNLLLTEDQHGTYASVDVQNLVETVVTHPNCSPWLSATLDKVIQRYGLNCTVQPSRLSHNPYS